MNWIQISDLTEIRNKLENQSECYIIFKHSTRCGTSSMAKKMFEKHWNDSIPVFLVHVVEDRQLSNIIENKFQVKHESPQLLLINNDICTYHTSHSNIDAKDVINFLLE